VLQCYIVLWSSTDPDQEMLMSDMPEDLDSQHQAPENILEAIGDDADPLENDSESNSDSSLGSDSHPDSGSSSGSDESSDSDDNGYGSF